MFRIRGLSVALAALAVASTHAQSFNIDLDLTGASPVVGGGAPSASFGAAAGQTGFWNAVDAGGPNLPTQLFDLADNGTSCMLQATGGIGSSGGWNNPINTGDFALLLNDIADVGDSITYHFTGFAPGRYLIYTYAVRPIPNSPPLAATVTVQGANSPVQFVTGPMPGNGFALGVTHSVHDLELTTTSFEVTVSNPGPPNSMVNGFQVVAVPEPSSLGATLAILVVLFRRRCRM